MLDRKCENKDCTFAHYRKETDIPAKYLEKFKETKAKRAAGKDQNNDGSIGVNLATINFNNTPDKVRTVKKSVVIITTNDINAGKAKSYAAAVKKKNLDVEGEIFISNFYTPAHTITYLAPAENSNFYEDNPVYDVHNPNSKWGVKWEQHPEHGCMGLFAVWNGIKQIKCRRLTLF